MRDKLTIQQRDLARHALGLPNKKRTSCRNRFFCGVGSADFDIWSAMVNIGAAQAFPVLEYEYPKAGRIIFILTTAGARAVLDPRERLDPEDFPEDRAHA